MHEVALFRYLLHKKYVGCRAFLALATIKGNQLHEIWSHGHGRFFYSQADRDDVRVLKHAIDSYDKKIEPQCIEMNEYFKTNYFSKDIQKY